MDEFNSYQWYNDDFQKSLVKKGPDHCVNTHTYYSEHVGDKKKKRKHKKFSLNYFTVALVSAIIGGLIFGVTFAFVSPMIFEKSSANHATAQKQYDMTPSSKTSNLLSPRNLDNGELKEMSVVDISKKVGPAVVGIVNKVKARSFFGQTIEQEGSGSGIIMSPDGYIVTNSHVVDGSSELKVILNTGKEYAAKIVGQDKRTDLAVLKIDATDLNYAEFGDSDKLEVGELAVAIGNPLGMEFAGSVTVGVISALNRTVTVDDKQLTLIQTDAAINPGNSGGALVNAYGQVIGINTVKIAASGVEGLGFAIPINEAKPVIEDLKAYGYVKGRPMIGISGREVTEEDSKMYDIPVGIYIVSVSPYSGAELAGLQPADVIIKCNGKQIKTMNELNEIKNQHKAGDELELTINRQGEILTVKVKLTEEKPSNIR